MATSRFEGRAIRLIDLEAASATIGLPVDRVERLAACGALHAIRDEHGRWHTTEFACLEFLVGYDEARRAVARERMARNWR